MRNILYNYSYSVHAMYIKHFQNNHNKIKHHLDSKTNAGCVLIIN